MSKFLNFDRALCLSPHPDDVEYSMGGTMAKFSSTAFDVVCLSEGGDCDGSSSPGRVDEARRFWSTMNCDNVSVKFAGVKHVKHLAEDAWINLLETNFVAPNNYEIIFTTSALDSHFEHRFVRDLAPPLSRLTRISLVEYCSPSTLEEWVPNLFVDIADEFELKLNALRAFSSQQGKQYFSEQTIRNFNSSFRCSKRGLNFVEQFRILQVYE